MMKTELETVRSATNKISKQVDDTSSKATESGRELELIKDSVDKLKKNIDRRPLAEEMDKKSELTNKLYNELSGKIDEVDTNLKKDVIKLKSDFERVNTDIKSFQ